MNNLYEFEKWIKEHWLLLVIFLIIFFILFAVIVFIINYIIWKKRIKEIKLMWKDKTLSKNNSIFDNVLSEFKISFFNFKISKNSSNKKIAWTAIIELLTRVVGNKFDEKYGDLKESLDSLYIIYKNLRDEIKEYPSAKKSNLIILGLMNNELRYFLTKWNYLINNKKVNILDNTYRAEYIKDYSVMYNSIIDKKYIENLLLIVGINLNFNKLVITNGVN